MQQVNKRKQELIRELNLKREQFDKLTRAQQGNIRELEKMRDKLRGMSAKQSATKNATNTFKSSLDAIEKQILDLRNSTPNSPMLTFSCSPANFTHIISSMGSINDPTKGPSKPSQPHKKQKAKTPNVGAVEKLQVLSPEYILTEKQWIYACNEKNVSFYKSSDFHGKIEIRGFKPTSIVTHMNHCYVTFQGEIGFYSCLSKFNKGDLMFISTVKETGGSHKTLEQPCGIALLQGNTLLVADSGNNRICAFDLKLNFKSEFGTKQLEKPTCIRVSGELVYVLNSNQWHIQVFNVSGGTVRCLLPVSVTQLKDPKSFALDVSGNIIITDYGTETIKKYSPDGKLIKKIGKESPGTPDVPGCYGVTVSAGGMVLVACKHQNCIKSISMK